MNMADALGFDVEEKVEAQGLRFLFEWSGVLGILTCTDCKQICKKKTLSHATTGPDMYILYHDADSAGLSYGIQAHSNVFLYIIYSTLAIVLLPAR